jgi:uncharacterized membrane protein YdjX (TVP38/TMEM64 family)
MTTQHPVNNLIRRCLSRASGFEVVLVVVAPLVIVGGLAVAAKYLLPEQYEHLGMLIATYWMADSVWSYFAIVTILAICAISGIVPLSLVCVVVGSLCGLWTGFLFSAIGTGLGAIVAFLASRYWIRKRLEARIARHVSLARLDNEVARQGARFVFAIRLSPIAPFSLISYAFGLTKVSTLDYVIGSFGALPGMFACVYSGAISKDVVLALGTQNPDVDRMKVLLLVIGLGATIIAIVAMVRAMSRSGIES